MTDPMKEGRLSASKIDVSQLTHSEIAERLSHYEALVAVMTEFNNSLITKLSTRPDFTIEQAQILNEWSQLLIATHEAWWQRWEQIGQPLN
jgi:hypothetical protein